MKNQSKTDSSGAAKEGALSCLGLILILAGMGYVIKLGNPGLMLGYAAIMLVVVLLFMRRNKLEAQQKAQIVHYQEELPDGLKITKSVDIIPRHSRIVFDDEQSKIMYQQDEENVIFSYKDIIGYSVAKDGEQVMDSKLGAAAIGGVLFGAVGAIAGASTKRKGRSLLHSLAINIHLNDIHHPALKIEFLEKPVAVTSDEYKEAATTVEEVAATLDYAKNKQL